MEKRHKDILRALVGKLRHILVGMPVEQGFVPGNLDRELERLGIDRDGNIAPIDALADIHNGDGQTYRIAATQLHKLPELKRSAARQEIIERAAYTWINRLLALRAMEVRGLIENTLRIEEFYGGISEKLYLLRLEEPQRASDADGGWWTVLKNACKELASPLPGLFALDDPDAALHPTADALIQCIELIGGKQTVLAGIKLEELDATFADPDAIGWAYQFYQEEAKASIDAKCKVGGKAATRSELAAKTQLFTEPYMVQWLLQNSLGRSYHEAYPQSQLPANWGYYIAPEQRGEQTTPQKIFFLEELTLLDPCMGSGHFLRAAFDMFVVMYREQKPHMNAKEIANRILDQHIFGIDLDPRAAQLSALTLYLRAWELVKEERGVADMSIYQPPEMHLATTPTNLDPGALERHLQRYPRDKVLKELLENIFTGLEHADVLGSLLRSREYLDQAIANLQRPHTIQMDETQEDADFRRTIIDRARKDPQSVRQMLLDRIAASFHAESNSNDDVSMALFGREAERGVRLLQVLDSYYAVVVTNPPYLGSKYMDTFLRKYVEVHYRSGKRDLYAAFILRCLNLCFPGGRVAMVTQQSWMFSRSYAELRAIPEEKLEMGFQQASFLGILRETSIETLAHLGEFAFEEAAGAFAAMFTLTKCAPSQEHTLVAFRLIGLKSARDKDLALAAKREKENKKIITTPLQNNFLAILQSPLVYYLSRELLLLFTQSTKLGEIADVRQGLATADNMRFTRCFWECYDTNRWKRYAKGGGYSKWAGLEWLVVDWQNNGTRIYQFGKGRFQGTDFYFQLGLTYTPISRGALGLRRLTNSIFDVKGSSLFPIDTQINIIELAACLSSHTCSYFTRLISQSLELHVGYLSQVPIPNDLSRFNSLGKLAEQLKISLVSANLVERSFMKVIVEYDEQVISALLHTCESIIEREVCKAYQISQEAIQTIIDETGTPVGWFPLIIGYDALPPLSDELESAELPQDLPHYLANHTRLTFDERELVHIKAKLRTLYEAGPRSKNIEAEEITGSEVEATEDNDEETMSGAYIPIPAETFLEELSGKMQLHPISVYWLLEELQATEMVRCKPEEKRLLEDRLSVLVLRLLGHRWPKQIEAFESVPDWADEDGIIPLVPGTGHRTLAERVRERLYVEEGAVGAQKLEILLRELTGQDLEQWLHATFFERHISQFKKRPIAWHLRSTPQRSSAGGKKKRGDSSSLRKPAFECILYYHACTGDALARIRTQYVEPLLKNERGKIDTTALFTEDTGSSFAQERIRELEAFVVQLRTIEEQGFACQELREIVAEEVPDRWSGDGYEPPADRATFQRGEEAWRVDINDGVRVNIAPLQLAGVLAKEVLNNKDAKKAVADRVRWRMDERRWVRNGKLPRCSWMDERVPASPAWTKEQAQREAGQKKAVQQAMLLDDGKLQGQGGAWS